MTAALQDDARSKRVMRQLQKVLRREYGELPDAVLILRIGQQGRTVVGLNPDQAPYEGANPRDVITAMLEEAVENNRKVNAAIDHRPGPGFPGFQKPH